MKNTKTILEQTFQTKQLIVEYQKKLSSSENRELKKYLREAIKKYNSLEAEAIKIIESFDDPLEKRLLYLRYIEHLSWENVAEILNYSPRHVLRLHNSILKRCH